MVTPVRIVKQKIHYYGYQIFNCKLNLTEERGRLNKEKMEMIEGK